MQCARCGYENKKRAKYCQLCGADFPKEQRKHAALQELPASKPEIAIVEAPPPQIPIQQPEPPVMSGAVQDPQAVGSAPTIVINNQIMNTNQNTANTYAVGGGTSYFDGGLLSYIGWILLGSMVTVLTLGICYPWALCMIYGWQINHTVVEGRRLRFTGTALGLFGNWIKWLLLCIVTLGIYSFWLGISLEKWKVKNTSFA